METFGTHPTTACNDGGRLRETVASENEQQPPKEANSEECPLYSANITAACHAASTASSRLYCTSKQEKLERRRLSNRRSALRKRVQEQEEIESLEEQIRFLAQANTCLKAEELRLEQLLRHAQTCIRGKKHFHKVEMENVPDSKPSASSNPSMNLQSIGGATPAFSQMLLPPTSFPTSRASVARRAALAQATLDTTTTPVGVNQWGHSGKSETLGIQSDPVSSSAGSSGEEMFAALAKFVDESEAKMYGLVTPPVAAGDGVSLPVRVKELPPQGLDAVWNVLLARAAQDSGLLHFLNNKAAACLSQGSAGPSSTLDAQNVSSAAAKQKPSLIASQQQPSDGTVPFGYASSYASKPTGFQIGKHEKSNDEHNARPDKEPSKLAEYFFQFDQKMEPAPSTFDCAFSDVSSSCSADLDRFLALDEQLE